MRFNKNSISFILILAIALLLYLIIGQVKQPNKWIMRYYLNENEPYDISAFYHCLSNQDDYTFQNVNTFVKSTEDEKINQTYLFFDNYFELNNTGKANIQQLLQNGNDVFFIIDNSASFEFNPTTDYSDIKWDEMNNKEVDYEGELYNDSTTYSKYDEEIMNNNADSISDNYNDEEETNEETKENFNLLFTDNKSSNINLKIANNTNISTPFIGHNNTRHLDWQSINENIQIGNEIAQSHATINDKPVWISSNFLNGKFHFISTPFIFTNYFLKSDSQLVTLNYFAEQIRHKNIRFFHNCSEAQINSKTNSNNSTIVNLIKNNKSLRLSFILFFIFASLFLFFGGKRTQNQLPIEKTQASSHVLKSLFISNYYLPKSRIILLKNKLIYQFETFVFNKTQINIDKATTKELEDVSTKLNIEIELLKNIIFEKNNNMDFNKKQFIQFHNQLVKIMNYGRN